jgi:uncharacterized cupin superfamily protein
MMKVWQPNNDEVKNTENWGIWEKEASKFQWFYDEKETCYIIEGEAEVSDKNGKSVRFTAGDMVHFEQGLECTWKILKAIKKRYKFG